MSKREKITRYVILLFGIFFVGFGIAFSKHSLLGISPISSVANVLSIKFDFLTVGTWLIIWNSLLVVIEILILRKNFKPIQFLQFPISLLLGVFTDLCLSVISDIPNEAYPSKLLLVAVGILVLSLGITLMIISNTVMNVGEEFVSVLSKLVNKPFGNVKLIFDISCVTLSIILSLAFFDFTIVGTREGTIITACCTGFIIKFFTKLLKKPFDKILKIK